MTSPGATVSPGETDISLWWQYQISVPSSSSTTVRFPYAPENSADLTVPPATDTIVDPDGPAKSNPVCVLAHKPLLSPKRAVRWYPVTGNTHWCDLSWSARFWTLAVSVASAC